MLSADQMRDYRDNGFLAPIRIMSVEEAADFRKTYERSFRERITADSICMPHKAASKFDIRDFQPHLYFKWAADLMRNSSLVSAVQQILGEDVLVWETQIFAKPAHSSSYIAWHQDLTYWGLDLEYEEVTAWIALSASTHVSGCMRVIPGTHKNDIVEHVCKDSKDSLLSLGQELAVSVDEEEAVDLVLMPGEMSLHHGKIFHASHGNQSDDARIGFAIRCLPTKACPVHGEQCATLLAGSDEYRHFNLLDAADDNEPTQKDIVDIARMLHL